MVTFDTEIVPDPDIVEVGLPQTRPPGIFLYIVIDIELTVILLVIFKNPFIVIVILLPDVV